VTSGDLSADDLARAPLGRPSGHPDQYAPSLLFAVPRAPQRAALGLSGALPFTGVDLWTAYELTWLDTGGKPQVALATLDMPIDSPSIIESKSMKLYLGSFAQTRCAGMTEIAAMIERDLSQGCGAQVGVALRGPAAFEAQSSRAGVPFREWRRRRRDTDEPVVPVGVPGHRAAGHRVAAVDVSRPAHRS
jgi:NADPH-dependent 7-cyano-7-deazaguanine reductase QueF-like protein